MIALNLSTTRVFKLPLSNRTSSNPRLFQNCVHWRSIRPLCFRLIDCIYHLVYGCMNLGGHPFRISLSSSFDELTIVLQQETNRQFVAIHRKPVLLCGRIIASPVGKKWKRTKRLVPASSRNQLSTNVLWTHQILPESKPPRAGKLSAKVPFGLMWSPLSRPFEVTQDEWSFWRRSSATLDTWWT